MKTVCKYDQNCLQIFHLPGTQDFNIPGFLQAYILQEYNDLVRRELMGERQQVNFLTADGVKFAHPLHHLGKAKEDLPLIAIDSFRHMYLFPKYEDMRIQVNNNLIKLQL